mmetsp:Transcript_11225/g.43748  ORF Transcript_11225/g.43748 Transcript_11225/m.43748 type:complete len:211 (-) Transcript_11225:772-1404(-)
MRGAHRRDPREARREDRTGDARDGEGAALLGEGQRAAHRAQGRGHADPHDERNCAVTLPDRICRGFRIIPHGVMGSRRVQPGHRAVPSGSGDLGPAEEARRPELPRGGSAREPALGERGERGSVAVQTADPPHHALCVLPAPSASASCAGTPPSPRRSPHRQRWLPHRQRRLAWRSSAASRTSPASRVRRLRPRQRWSRPAARGGHLHQG